MFITLFLLIIFFKRLVVIIEAIEKVNQINGNDFIIFDIQTYD